MCATASLRAGAGMVRLGSPGDAHANWPTEVVRMPLSESDWAEAFLTGVAKCGAVAIGPGLGTDDHTQEQIRTIIRRVGIPLVIDADAITALGDANDARALLAQRTAATVITPHDGEYTRLAGSPPSSDRLQSARDLARRIGAVVLLKGPLTAVASPEDIAPDVLLSSAGVPALATAGTGDVLTGVIAAFLARGIPAHPAAALAAHVHGRAAALGLGDGLISGDLPDLVARVLNSSLHG